MSRGGVEEKLFSFFNLGRRWGGVVKATPRPLYPPGKTRYPLCRRMVVPHGRSGLVRKISHTWIRTPGRPARSESLYRLRLPGPKIQLVPKIKRPKCETETKNDLGPTAMITWYNTKLCVFKLCKVQLYSTVVQYSCTVQLYLHMLLIREIITFSNILNTVSHLCALFDVQEASNCATASICHALSYLSHQ
jgi:hypothetical protein